MEKDTKDYKLGRFLIKNVPLEYFNREATARGELIYRTIHDSLQKLIEHMEKEELTTYDYEDWLYKRNIETDIALFHNLLLMNFRWKLKGIGTDEQKMQSVKDLNRIYNNIINEVFFE